MTKEIFITSVGLALFIICPRMAGMVNIIAKNSQVPMIPVAILGSVLSIPLVIVIVLVFSKFGLWGALAFCVLTDLAAAVVMKGLSLKAGIETLVIAIFVIIGVRIAPLITGLFLKG